MKVFRHALLLTCAAVGVDSAWEVCANTNSIKPGSCNSAIGPCEPGSGCINAGKVGSIEECESKCEASPGCVAIEWHNNAGGWTDVCVLQNQSAWHPYKQNGHEAACLKADSFPDCKCSGGPSPSPGPSAPTPAPGTDPIQCFVHKIAYEQSTALLSGRGSVEIYDALNLGNCPNVTKLESVPATMPAVERPNSAAFYVSPTGNDANSGTSAQA